MVLVTYRKGIIMEPIHFFLNISLDYLNMCPVVLTPQNGLHYLIEYPFSTFLAATSLLVVKQVETKYSPAT